MVCDVCECGLVMVDWRALRRSKTELFDVAGRKGRGLALKGRAFPSLESLPRSSSSPTSHFAHSHSHVPLQISLITGNICQKMPCYSTTYLLYHMGASLMPDTPPQTVGSTAC